MAPKDAAPPTETEDQQVAGGRPVGISSTTFATAAPSLLDDGYEPLPIRPGTKRPVLTRWSDVPIDAASVERWSQHYPGFGVGLRTGRLVGLDIDLLDPDLAHRVGGLVQARLGETLMRVGQWPKRLLLYRTRTPFPKMALPGVEVLGAGQQVVAFGLHPGTRQPYHWPMGDTPLDVPLEDLPQVDAAACEDLLAEVAALLPLSGASIRRDAKRERQQPGTASPIRDPNGLVTDGRDGWLSSIAYHAVHDALARAEPLDRESLSRIVWERFATTTDLERPRSVSGGPYGPHDAARKVADKLRLLAEGRLPPRDPAPVQADYHAPPLSVTEARDRLDAQLRHACEQIEAWHSDQTGGPCPQIGIRATVGLGKSVSARRHLLALRDRLTVSGAPSRIAVFTPSHALAEETAEAWRGDGASVAVLRGYEARHPSTREPMCRDLEAVRAAVAAGVDVHSSACASTGGRRCALFEGCAKQRNRAEVEAADVVVAAYDALYTGFAVESETLGLLLIDEGCWARALRETRGVWVETFGQELITGSLGQGSATRTAEATADLLDPRSRAAAAFVSGGMGAVTRSSLLRAGLTRADCLEAARLEERRLSDPGLYPGMPKAERVPAMERARTNERTYLFIDVWRAMAALLGSDRERDGRLEVRGPAQATGLHEIVATGVRTIHHTLRGKPVLHLDATLRLELARAILPELAVSTVEAAAPHMTLRLVTGSFGKGSLCQDGRAAAQENQRRSNRLGECVDHVRWQARRVAPGRVLVVTYKDCEAAFGGIPGVETAHFNAIAGLDRYRDVRLLIIIGRPLPSEPALHPLCGAFFGHEPAGGYRHAPRGVRMRDGASRTVRVIAHEDERAEVLRAAICDDELIQAIGRGRGVNRTAADPLEVQVLASVALPLVHDRVLAWETVVPDIVQRMLLTGIATDSPADAAVLHPALFANPEQAEKAFPRAGFNRQNPIRNTYREMSVKSAAYRRTGRGRSWQRAYWIDGDGSAVAAGLSRALGPLAEWSPGTP